MHLHLILGVLMPTFLVGTSYASFCDSAWVTNGLQSVSKSEAQAEAYCTSILRKLKTTTVTTTIFTTTLTATSTAKQTTTLSEDAVTKTSVISVKTKVTESVAAVSTVTQTGTVIVAVTASTILTVTADSPTSYSSSYTTIIDTLPPYPNPSSPPAIKGRRAPQTNAKRDLDLASLAGIPKNSVTPFCSCLATGRTSTTTITRTVSDKISTTVTTTSVKTTAFKESTTTIVSTAYQTKVVATVTTGTEITYAFVTATSTLTEASGTTTVTPTPTTTVFLTFTDVYNLESTGTGCVYNGRAATLNQAIHPTTDNTTEILYNEIKFCEDNIENYYHCRVISLFQGPGERSPWTLTTNEYPYDPTVVSCDQSSIGTYYIYSRAWPENVAYPPVI